MAGTTKLTNSEIAVFCEQLAYTMGAGISLEEGLLVIGEGLEHAEGFRITMELADAVGAGGTFAAALRASGKFPHYMAQMVEIGETSGRLEQVLSSLAAYYGRQEALARNIKSSVAYPLVMIVMMVAVVLVILTQVLPVFQEVFRGLGSEMSGFVQGLLQFGNAISRYTAVIIIAAAALAALFFILRTQKRGRDFLAAIRARLFKKTSAAVSSGRFASAMAMMLGSGMDVDEALSMAGELVEDKRSRRKIALMKQKMAKGMGFADATQEAGMFSGLYGKMISVGFKTGTLDSVMDRIAGRYEEEAARRMEAIVSALEPTLVAVLSIIVGMILLAVMLPLLGVMSAIG
ncbi:type II secretion system F family protein [Christensenella tenuis]|uniref:Type II secretion system F family protein n=1 Tax=Christensenella tenuis TaxID=2763033 RepID=A0ABR7EIQ1_9FIRM|nr:type II secretion system F family protein [Christensenella tenuis]MBC5649024.1 type II secretion system F family protein [Christensenella tenuis]